MQVGHHNIPGVGAQEKGGEVKSEKRLKVIAIDADDTLWDCQGHFGRVMRHLYDRLVPWTDRKTAALELYATERKNMRLLGYGVKAFTLSMLETAMRVSRNEMKAEEIADKVVSVFDQIPPQLSKHEKKFRLSALKPGAKYRDWDDAFFWLKDARVVNICYNSTEPNIGLKMNEDRTTLKCYMNDTGLLISHAFDEKGIVSSEIYQKLLFGKLEVNEGMLIENIVAQMLTASGNKLFFYSKSSEEAEERMEIDFLLQKDKVTSRHNIRPIEVKSGKNYTLSSLKKCMNKFGEYMTTPTVLHAADYKVEDGITYLPLYMTPLL